MELMGHKENQYSNNKQNKRSKARYERKQALKNFKKLKQQLVDQHLEKSNEQADAKEMNIFNIPPLLLLLRRDA